MHYVWWSLAAIFGLISFVFLIGIFNPKIFNSNLKEGEKPWGRKQAIWSFVICFIVLSFFANLADSNSSKETTSKSTVAVVSKETKPKETVAQKKAEEAAIAKKNMAAKNKIKDDYTKNVKPAIDSFLEEYDTIWNTYWTPTFNTLASGNYDQYKSYDALIKTKQQYEDMMPSLSVSTVDGMTSDDENNLSDFEQNARTAAMLRSEAAKIAADAIDKGNFPPSVVSEIKDKISQANNFMLTSIIDLTTVEKKYGIKR